MSITIGIDIGTTNCCAAVWRNGRPEIIEMASDQRWLPSVVTFLDADSDPVVGRTAINEGKHADKWSFRNVKRLMGQRAVEGEDHGAKIAVDEHGMLALVGPDRLYSPSEITAFLLMAILDAAEAKLGERPDGAVITVPADFRDPERAATREAARLAGLAPDRVHLINEPTAAGVAHGYSLDKFATLAVFDLGGGTFDITIFKTGRGLVEVLSSKGASRLGGLNFDERISARALKGFFEKHGVDLGARPKTMPRVLEAAEETKKHLTDEPRSSVRVDFVDSAGPDGVRHMDESISRDDFNADVADLIQMTIDICGQAVADAGIAVKQIDALILVGGMTHVPAVSQAAADFFQCKPRADINPKEVVALGAAIEAARRDGVMDKLKIIDRTSHTLGLETLDNRVFEVLPRGTAYPCERTIPITNARDGQTRLSIHILQGNDHRADQNTLLSHAAPECAPAGAGEAALDVTFAVDASGSVQVRCGDELIYRGDVQT